MLNQAIRCELLDIIPAYPSFRMRVKLIDAHPMQGAKTGEFVTTSAVKSIDFISGIAYTRSGTVYLFEPLIHGEFDHLYMGSSTDETRQSNPE